MSLGGCHETQFLGLFWDSAHGLFPVIFCLLLTYKRFDFFGFFFFFFCDPIYDTMRDPIPWSDWFCRRWHKRAGSNPYCFWHRLLIESSQKHLPAAPHLSHIDHGSRSAFCIQLSSRPSAHAHILHVLCASMLIVKCHWSGKLLSHWKVIILIIIIIACPSTCCKTSLCLTALSR